RTPGLVASPLPGRRVAGHRTAGLRLVPPAGSPTTVERVDLWAEPRTGLPLRVEVTARGLDRPVLVAELLDLSLAPPPLVRVAFAPLEPAQVLEAPDLAAQMDRFAPYLLPDSLGGQPRRDLVAGLQDTGGVGTYGDGLAVFAVLPLPNDVGRRALRAVDPTDTDGRAAVSTPLLNAVVLRDGRRVYLLAGTVPAAVLDRAAAQLLADRPPRTRR
ncbi:MAG: hypothetical protein JWM64_2306, partial [Frankiales bacterium]|nr:hypothetical protein [Frankiales bacterium]